MSLIKSYLHTLQMNNQFEMLSQREQLMEDIDSIIEVFFDERYDMDDPDIRSVCDDLTSVLCDAVCTNFPTN